MRMCVEMNKNSGWKKKLQYFKGLIQNILKGLNNVMVLEVLVLQLQMHEYSKCRLASHFDVARCFSQCWCVTGRAKPLEATSQHQFDRDKECISLWAALKSKLRMYWRKQQFVQRDVLLTKTLVFVP
jgi:hypothetical protein